MDKNALPDRLKELLRNTDWHSDTLGMSSAQTFRIDGPEKFFLKINAVDPWGGLKAEADALTWLWGRLPAPEIVFYERANGTDYLLMRALPGLSASDDYWKTNPERLVKILADSMRALHNLNPADCPFDQRIDIKLQKVTEYVQRGLVDTDEFDSENSEKTPETILNQLHAERPVQEDLVVTHGDFCLPNLILDNWQLGGFIDVGSLGVGDRYQDLALCLRDLTDELDTDHYTNLFLTAYGLDAVDDEKLRYFRLLDELN